MSEPNQHVVTALVQNEAGTINRLVSLFRRRGFSLASFNAGDCEEDGFSRLTLLVNGNNADVAQCLKQLDKLVDVVECEDLSPQTSVTKELALVRVEPKQGEESAIAQTASEFLARIVAKTEKVTILEISEDPAAIERLVAALRPYNVTEVVRTGIVAIKLES